MQGLPVQTAGSMVIRVNVMRARYGIRPSPPPADEPSVRVDNSCAYDTGAAAEFAATLDGKVDHVAAGTLDRAVALAARDAEAAKLTEAVVLLSPACASFDQFPNFEVRGKAFRDLVRALPGVAGS